MLSLPTRTIQQKRESDSFAILMYKLKHIGIFRNLTQHDFGIDFELEEVIKDQVTGKSIKLQVKSSDIFTEKKNGRISISGIKQSTLNYWTQISLYQNVYITAVETKTERIFISDPIFWQVISLIDENDKTKTVELKKSLISQDSISKHSINSTKSNDIRILDNIVTQTSFELCLKLPTVSEIIYKLKDFINCLPQYLKLYSYLYSMDFQCEYYLDERNNILAQLIQTNVILQNEFEYLSWYDNHKNNPQHLEITGMWAYKKVILSHEDLKHTLNFDYWVKQSSNGISLSANIAIKPVHTLLILLVNKFREYRNIFINSKYYWYGKDPILFETITTLKLPEIHSTNDIFELYNLLEDNAF